MKTDVFRAWCATGALLLPALLAGAAHAQEDSTLPADLKPVDYVVAVVNDDVVTRHELDVALNNVIAQLRQQNADMPSRDVLEKQVLERVITNRVQLQYAKETGLIVDDPTLEKTIARIADGNHLTPDQLRQALAHDGIDFANFREDVRNEIIISQLRQREVEARIQISDSEVDNYLKNAQTSGGQQEFNLSHILIRVPEQADPEQVKMRRARADEALAQLRGGADFRKVAAGFSDAPDATQGGLIGWREYGRLPPMFAEAVSKLQPGEVTEIMRSNAGFHIMRLNDKRGQDTPTIVQQVHARHILIKTNEVVSEQEAHERIVKIKDRLNHGADFAQLARQQSEDMSAANGGDLGWLTPGDTVPEFEKAMDGLQPGQISDPVQTQFGFHLIQVMERRDTDMSKEQQRGKARAALRAQRSDEAYQDWVRQLRDKAFVEIRLDDNK